MPEYSTKRRLPVLAFLLIAVLAAGCVQQQVKKDPNDGLKITEFKIDPDDVDSRDMFTLSALVENTGGTTARNVEVKVFGIPWAQNLILLKKDSLRPPDVERSISGGAAFGQEQLTAPDLPEGVTHRFIFNARAYYDYSSTGSASIPVLSKAEFDRKRLRNDPMPAMTVGNSDAPIKVDIVGSSPIVADSGEFFYRFVLKNTGSGVPVTSDKAGNEVTGLIIGTISIDGGAVFRKCLNTEGGGNKIDLPKDKTGILLRRGESVTVPCSIELGSNWMPTPAVPQGALLIKFDLTYKYYTEQEALLAIHGKRQPAKVPAETGTLTPPTGPAVPGPADTGINTEARCRANSGTCSSPWICDSTDQIGTCDDKQDGNYICCKTAGPRPIHTCTRPSNENCMDREPLSGLYRVYGGVRDTKPFGNWCNSIINEMKNYYLCLSDCQIDIGARDSPLIPPPIPKENECR